MQNRPNIFARIRSIFGSTGKTVTREELGTTPSPITDNNFFPHGLSQSYIDRHDYNREKILAECLRAWRVQPLARRIVKIITAFVIGAGFTVKSKHKGTQVFLSSWWNHPLNVFDEQLSEWLDERTRSGNIFALATVDAAGMTYWRAIPADQIKEIESKPNDIRQEVRYIPQDPEGVPWIAYDPDTEQTSFVVHHSIDRPVGTAWGEPPLAPLLPWIGRYSAWLEDRVRLNRFRNAFMYVVRGTFTDKTQKEARQKELNASPPQPGSILVTDTSEDWGILNANLDAFDATMDGQSVKTHIAAGIGFPMHWFSEGESSTRTTAEAAGTPTFKSLEQEQTSFVRFIIRLAQISVTIRAKYDKAVDPKAEITIAKPDITERDNANLALAVSRIYPALSEMFDRQGINEAELLRLVYRMAGEAYDSKKTPPKMTVRPLRPVGVTPVQPPTDPNANPQQENPV